MAEDVGALRGGGAVKTITVVTRATIEGMRFCVAPKDVSLGRSSLDPQAAEFMINFVRSAMAEFNGLCTTYHRATQGYVASAVGRNDPGLHLGDDTVHFFPDKKKLRSQ